MSESCVHAVTEVGDPWLGSHSWGSAATERGPESHVMPDTGIYLVFPGCTLPKKGSFSACLWREGEELGCIVVLSTLDALGAGMHLAAVPLRPAWQGSDLD